MPDGTVRLRSAVLGTALVTALVSWLAAGALAPRDARAAPGPARVVPADEGWWWVRAGAQASATVAFGPRVETAHGPGRPWALTVHLPGTPEPLTCVQGLVDLEDAHAVSARGDLFLVELRPADGLLWGDVAGPEALAVRVEGLY